MAKRVRLAPHAAKRHEKNSLVTREIATVIAGVPGDPFLRVMWDGHDVPENWHVSDLRAVGETADE